MVINICSEVRVNKNSQGVLALREEAVIGRSYKSLLFTVAHSRGTGHICTYIYICFFFFTNLCSLLEKSDDG